MCLRTIRHISGIVNSARRDSGLASGHQQRLREGCPEETALELSKEQVMGAEERAERGASCGDPWPVSLG